MKRKSISINNALKLINWEIAHCKQQCGGGANPKDVEEIESGMKIIWFDLTCYRDGNDNLIKDIMKSLNKN